MFDSGVSAGPVARKIHKGDWASWFAWKPVRTVSGKRAWGRKVYRRLITIYVDTEDWQRYEYGDMFDVIREEK